MSSVYPMSHRSVPTRRNSTGNFKANRISTGVIMLPALREGNRPKVLLRRDQLMIDGKQRQFQTVRNPDLVENIPKMMLHRLFTDRELSRNFAVGKTGDDRSDNLQLSRGETERFSGFLGLFSR